MSGPIEKDVLLDGGYCVGHVGGGARVQSSMRHARMGGCNRNRVLEATGWPDCPVDRTGVLDAVMFP